MARYVYPAVFHPSEDGSFTIIFPDLPGCVTEGKSLENALYMAQAALTAWLECTLEDKTPLPAASALRDVPVESGAFVNFIRADVKENRAVRRTVSIPKWMDDQVSEAGLSLSRVLQDALRERLGVN